MLWCGNPCVGMPGSLFLFGRFGPMCSSQRAALSLCNVPSANSSWDPSISWCVPSWMMTRRDRDFFIQKTAAWWVSSEHPFYGRRVFVHSLAYFGMNSWLMMCPSKRYTFWWHSKHETSSLFRLLAWSKSRLHPTSASFFWPGIWVLNFILDVLILVWKAFLDVWTSFHLWLLVASQMFLIASCK